MRSRARPWFDERTPSRPTPPSPPEKRPTPAAPATIRDVGRIAAPIDASGAALEPGSTARVDVVVRTPQDRALLPRRHRGRVRRLAGTASAGCRRQGHLLEWQRGRWRQGPGGAGRAFLSFLPARRRIQPDQQAQRVADPQPALRATDSAGRGRRRALSRGRPQERPRPHPLHREAELSQICLVLHAILVRAHAPGPARTRHF